MLIKAMLSYWFIKHHVLQAKIVLLNNVELFYTPEFAVGSSVIVSGMFMQYKFLVQRITHAKWLD